MSPKPAPVLVRLAALLAGTALAAAALAQPAIVQPPPREDEAAVVQRLLAGGRGAEALARVERALAADPRDAQLRFLHGVALAEQRRTDEAIAAYTDLTRDHPDLAEPYNNLAVLQAAQGRYGEARESLEMAIRNRPGYATAHENLGDVLARLAAESLRRARELDPRRRGIDARLAALRAVYSPLPASDAAAPPAGAASAAAPGAAR